MIKPTPCPTSEPISEPTTSLDQYSRSIAIISIGKQLHEKSEKVDMKKPDKLPPTFTELFSVVSQEIK